jgi:hypothetical protein
MVKELLDEEYVEFSGYTTKAELLKDIKEWLISGYQLEVLPNGYLHIVNEGTRVLQWRRKYAARASFLIPKFLTKVRK